VYLLERERELAELERLVMDAKAGDARLALIEGPAGIGKTQLMGELRRRAAAAELRVLSARGSELEREFPFGVVRQLFEPVLDEAVFSGAVSVRRRSSHGRRSPTSSSRRTPSSPSRHRPSAPKPARRRSQERGAVPTM